MCGNLLLFALNILAVIRFAILGNIDAHVRTQMVMKIKDTGNWHRESAKNGWCFRLQIYKSLRLALFSSFAGSPFRPNLNLFSLVDFNYDSNTIPKRTIIYAAPLVSIR